MSGRLPSYQRRLQAKTGSSQNSGTAKKGPRNNVQVDSFIDDKSHDFGMIEVVLKNIITNFTELELPKMLLMESNTDLCQ